MTRKVLSVILTLILVFSLACCADRRDKENSGSQITSYEITENESVSSLAQEEQNSQAPVSADKANSSGLSNPSTSSVTSQEEKAPVAPDISKISCRKASEINWQTVKVTVKACKYSFEFDIPSDWVLNELSDGGFEILCSGKKIGTILAEDISHGESLDADYSYSSDYSASVYSYSKWEVENGEGTLYKQLILSTYPQNSQIELHILLNYEELDNEAVKNIAGRVSVYEAKPEFVPMSQTNGAKKILILGNSFVASSQIGSFLSAMLEAADSEYSVEAISINGANVKTFIERTDIVDKIKSGEYCYVFQCGFYSSIAVSAFQTVKEYCKYSDTIPVLFPAHNENAASVSHAKGQYIDTIFLDWQTELDDFIRSGVNRYDLCYDDANDHSKPLAGYVGAHMIYRSLFGKLPPAEISCEVQSMESIRSYLGDYIETGIVPGTNTRPAFSGKQYTIS